MSAPEQTLLAKVLESARPGFACGEDAAEGVFQIRMNNITRSGGLDLGKRRLVPADHKAIDGTLLAPEDVLFNMTNSPDMVGKTALFPGLDEPVVYSNHFLRLRADTDQVYPGYLARWLHQQFERGVFKAMCRQWVNQATVGKDDLLSLLIPILPIDEQRFAADLLDRVDAVRVKRREALALVDRLAQATFVEMFGNVAANDRGWDDSRTLGKVADIVSGITKGRKADGPFERVPYLAVVNVQSMRLDLSTVKEIDATAAEIAKYRLKRNDLLLTEGGDPDKLGRGTLWREELPLAIHQNHIFRVRLHDDAGVDAVFLNWLVGSERGRRYFLRSAKQTTGIASINATQLREFPLLVPPTELQRSFASYLANLQAHKELHLKHLANLDALFGSIQQRAFRGVL